MGWVNNSAVKAILKVNNVDLSSTFVSYQVSDSSIVMGGIVSTVGSVVLREGRGTPSLQDYTKEKFARGIPVRLDLEIDGSVKRHPRGTLLVLDSGYNTEERSVILEVGCLLTLYAMTNNIENIKNHTSFELPKGAGFSELSSALQAENQFIYVDKDGVIQKRNFFGNDGQASIKDEAQWLSIRDQTALSASPLGVGNPVPDKIVITFSWVEDSGRDEGDTDDSGNPVDQDITESHYFLEHPANIYGKTTICQPTPDGNQQCADFIQQDAKRTFGVTKTNRNQRHYGATGGSTSSEVSITEGPAVELNGSYYAERYSWEVARASGDAAKEAVNPRGLENIVQDRREKTYEYGSAGEVVKTHEYHFRHLLNAMTQQDWRASGNTPTNAATSPTQPATQVMRGFLTEIPDGLFLSQVSITSWEYFDDRTVETRETITSTATCGQTGIYSKGGDRELLEIGAYENGVKTTEVRTSRGGLVNPDQTPRNPGGVPVNTKSDTVIDNSYKYTPTSAGSILQNYTVPFVVTSQTQSEARSMAVAYASNMRWALEGDAAGIRIAETMRSEIFNYFPGMPFSFYDPTEGVLIKLRMNACSWGVNDKSGLFSTDGIFIGKSNADVTLGNNTTGVFVAPSIDNTTETNIDTGRGGVDATEVIEIKVGIGAIFSTGNGDDGFGIIETHDQPLETLGFFNVGINIEGQKLSKESELLGLDVTGGLLSGDGLILETGEEVIDPDLFDPLVEPGVDDEYLVTTGPLPPNNTYQILVQAKIPDQLFDIAVSAKPAGRIFGIEVITVLQVLKADQEFTVIRGAQTPDQIFNAVVGPSAADEIYTVTREATSPAKIFDIRITNDPFVVTTGVAIANRVYVITTGLAPAPTPDQEYGVSVGGEGALQPAAPTETYQITRGPTIYDKRYAVKVVNNLIIDIFEAPFDVTVSADPPTEIFSITTNAKPADKTFVVTSEAKTFAVAVGPTLPTQAFEVLTGTRLDVTVGVAIPDTTFTVTIGA